MSKSPFGIWRKIKNVWIYFLVRNKGPLFGKVHPDSVITRTPIGYSALWLSLLWLKLGQCHEWTPSEPYTHTRRAASNDTFRSTFYRKLTWIISKCVFFLNQKRNEYFFIASIVKPNWLPFFLNPPVKLIHNLILLWLRFNFFLLLKGNSLSLSCL